jgi:hypothetical protein
MGLMDAWMQAVEALQTCGAPVQADICCCCVNLPEKRYVYSHGFKLGFVGTLPAADGPMKKLLSMFDSVERSAEVRDEHSDTVLCVHRSYLSDFALYALESHPRGVRQGCGQSPCPAAPAVGNR